MKDFDNVWHVYLRGNFKNDMFYNQDDKINVWNRLWLAALSTGTQILSAVILDNHLHINVIQSDDAGVSDFMHFFRLSITQYHNHRYHVQGTLGTRTFGRAPLKGNEDIKDCICYHARNTLHHKVFSNFMDYPFCTARWVFGLMNIDPDSCYNCKSLPSKVRKKYMPHRRYLPVGWLMTQQGMIVPPVSVLRADLVEELFGTLSHYIVELSHVTRREKDGQDTPEPSNVSRLTRETMDNTIAEYVAAHFKTPVPCMDTEQKIRAIEHLMTVFPKAGKCTLARVFNIPRSTLLHWLKIMDTFHDSLVKPVQF